MKASKIQSLVSWRCIPNLSELVLLATLVGCGGGSPLGNPPAISNSTVTGGQSLSFDYFQRCIDPIFLTQLQITNNGVTSTNTCAGGGCHADATGAGGAFRVVANAQPVDLSNPANTPAVIKTTDMYKNFYSAQGEVIVDNPLQSKLLNKPLLRGTLHGGGLIFLGVTDPNVIYFTYWITHPLPKGQDEFTDVSTTMFLSGVCNT